MSKETREGVIVALQEYIDRKPERGNKKIVSSCGTSILMSDMVKEIKAETEVGLDYEKALYKMTIESLLDGDNLPLCSFVMNDKNGSPIYADSTKFTFEFLDSFQMPVTLTGTFTYHPDELRYEIDIENSSLYAVLSYNQDLMRDFKIINTKENNEK